MTTHAHTAAVLEPLSSTAAPFLAEDPPGGVGSGGFANSIEMHNPFDGGVLSQVLVVLIGLLVVIGLVWIIVRAVRGSRSRKRPAVYAPTDSVIPPRTARKLIDVNTRAIEREVDLAVPVAAQSTSKGRSLVKEFARHAPEDHFITWVYLFSRNAHLIDVLSDRAEWARICAEYEYLTPETIPEILWIGVTPQGARGVIICTDTPTVGLVRETDTGAPTLPYRAVEEFFMDLIDTDTVLVERPVSGIFRITFDLYAPHFTTRLGRAAGDDRDVPDTASLTAVGTPPPLPDFEPDSVPVEEVGIDDFTALTGDDTKDPADA